MLVLGMRWKAGIWWRDTTREDSGVSALDGFGAMLREVLCHGDLVR